MPPAFSNCLAPLESSYEPYTASRIREWRKIVAAVPDERDLVGDCTRLPCWRLVQQPNGRTPGPAPLSLRSSCRVQSASPWPAGKESPPIVLASSPPVAGR